MKPREQLAVITCHYNFAGYDRPRANLMRFLRQMALYGVPVYGVEIYLKGEKPFTQNVMNWRQIEVTERSIMWQKEALLNVAEKMVPAQYRYLSWIDADIFFDTLDWPDRLVAALRVHKVVQPFEYCVFATRQGVKKRTWQSCYKVGLNKRWTGFPGYAMAAQRELWTACGGLYDAAVVGSGDIVFCASVLFNDPATWLMNRSFADGLGLDVPVSMDRLITWWLKMRAWTGGQAHYIGGTVWHEWHGEWKDRKYVERCEWMKGFDPHKEVKRLPSGVWQWTDQADPQRVEALKGLFTGRKEDG